MIEQRKARQLAAEATNGGASRGADASAAPPQSWAARTLDGKGRAGGAYKWAVRVATLLAEQQRRVSRPFVRCTPRRRCAFW